MRDGFCICFCIYLCRCQRACQRLGTGRRNDGLRQRMRAARLHGSSDTQYRIALQATEQSDRLQLRPALGQRASFVENHMRCAMQGFQHMRLHDQHPLTQQTVRRCGQRRWRCERQCTRAGDDEYRNRNRPGARRIMPKPEQQNTERQHQQRSDKPCSDAIRPLRNFRFALTGTLDHSNQRRKRAVFRHAFDTQYHRLANIDCTAHHLLAGAPPLRLAFAGQQRQVECGFTGNDHAVRCNRVAGFGKNHIARTQLHCRYTGRLLADRIILQQPGRIR